MDLPNPLLAPLLKGQTVGTLRLMLDDTVLTERPLVALIDAPEAGFFGRMSDELMLWWQSK